MRILMMGTGPFAVPTFESLCKSTDHDVVGLFTRPVPPPKGRVKQAVNPMRDVGEVQGLPIYDPPDVNAQSAHQQITALKPELLVVCDYGQILSDTTLGRTPLGGINLHGSLLPKYRGAAPVNWAIYHGESQTGVTVIHMTPRLDAGPCLVTRTIDIRNEDNAVTLEHRLAALGPEAIDEAIGILSQWDGTSVIGEVQDQKLASRAPRLRKADGAIDWARTASELFNQIRAFKPWPGSFTFVPHAKGPQRVIVDHAIVVDLSDASAAPGTVLSSATGELFVQTGSGALSIERIQPAGKRVMDIAEFLRGHPIATGEQLGQM